jgi:phosphoglucosamine mutase
MTRLFGTDGIRGLANVDPVSPEIALALGRATVVVLAPVHHDRKPTVVVGRDTRLSGTMLEGALIAGLCAAGANVLSVGVLPTAGVAYLTRTCHATAGVMISASHNSFEDNGIKLFSGSGYKLEDGQEDAIAAIVTAEPAGGKPVTGGRVGQCFVEADAVQRYTNFLASTFAGSSPLNLRIGLDCAHGAAATVAPELFRHLGAYVSVCHAAPNGQNINQDCGSLHPERLQRMVVDEALDIGFAFDGDADRLVAIDHTGAILDGDYILAISAQDLKTRGVLAHNMVVSTVMANLGLDKTLQAMDVELHKTKVGDKYVMQDMREHGAILGGEQSGHILYLDHHTTGDGLLTAVQLLNAMSVQQVPLKELAQILRKYPQVLVNVRLRHRCDPLQDARVRHAVQSAESALHEDGRILVRLSGTEPVARVMVEGPTQEVIEPIAERIAQTITDAIGGA